MKAEIYVYQRRIRAALRAYTAICIVVCLFTLYMGTRDNIFTVSMSAMGNTSPEMHIAFIVWTIAFCAYFASLTGFIFIMVQNGRSRLRFVVFVAVGVMIFGDIMPFVPTKLPALAYLHDICAQIASVGLAVTLMLLALTIMRMYPNIFRRALAWVLIIWTILLALMGIFGTKAITELVGLLAGSVYLVCFAWWIGSTATFNPVQALSTHDAEQAEEEALRLERRAQELRTEYLRMESRAREARLAAEELRRIERGNRRKTVV